MSTLLFHASCVTVVENEVGWIVGLADQELNISRYLQFQRSHASDAQDKALGLDAYYVEKDDQSNSCYGGIETIELRANSISLKLDDVGSRRLNLDKLVIVAFDTDEETLNELRIGLAAIFSGTNAFREEVND